MEARVTVRRLSILKKIWKKLFYVPKYAELKDDNISHMLLPSFIGIAVCAVCLVGLTLAWFNASVEVAPQRLMAASFSVTVEVKSEDGASTTGAKTVTFSEAGVYTLSLHPQGGGSGYCKIEAQGKVYYTQSFKDGEFLLKVEVADKGVCSITACLGTYAGTETISSGSTIKLALESAGGESSTEQPDTTVPTETAAPATEPAPTDPAPTEPVPTEVQSEPEPTQEPEQTEAPPEVSEGEA